jgi:hypothetical protein
MGVFAAEIQVDMRRIDGSNAVFGIFYGIVDSVALTGGPCETEVFVPMAAPGTWTDLFVASVVADAAARGYTITAENVRWYPYEPGDYKYSIQAVNWTKDKTFVNVGTAYVNVYAGSAGEGQLVHFGPYKQYRLVVHANKVGTGTQDVGLMDVTNSSNVVAISDAGAAGEKTLDSGWTNLPAWMTGEQIVKPVAKSSVSADDPVYHQVALYLR